MNDYPRLAWSAYFVAFLLIFIPCFDALMSVFPWQLGSAQWRYGAVGLLSNAMMIPAVGGLIAVVTAVSQEHERTRRALGVASWVLAALVSLTVVLFALDTLQARSLIRPDMKLSYQVASVTAATKLFFGIITLILFGVACRTEYEEE